MKKIALFLSLVLFLFGCTFPKFIPGETSDEEPLEGPSDQLELNQSPDDLLENIHLEEISEIEGVSASEKESTDQENSSEILPEDPIAEIDLSLLDESENLLPPSEHIALDVNPPFEQLQPGAEDETEASFEEIPPEGAPAPETEGTLTGEIEIFEDYQCPYCKQFEKEALIPLRNKHLGVSIVFRHFPLSSIHPNAYESAKFSVCAENQGKFVEVSDALFLASDLSTENLWTLAGNLQLDTELLTTCLDSSDTVNRIEADRTRGQSLGVTGTPTFFINGNKFKGAYPLENVEMELRKFQKNKK